jgi:hypothetical protein
MELVSLIRRHRRLAQAVAVDANHYWMPDDP